MGYDADECWACYAMHGDNNPVANRSYDSDDDNDNDNDHGGYFSCCSACMAQFEAPNGRMAIALQQNGTCYDDCKLCGMEGSHQSVAFCNGCVKHYKRDILKNGECLMCHFEDAPDQYLDPYDCCYFCSSCFQDYAAKLTSSDKDRFATLATSVHDFSFDTTCNGCSCRGTAYKVRICDHHFYGDSAADAASPHHTTPQ